MMSIRTCCQSTSHFTKAKFARGKSTTIIGYNSTRQASTTSQKDPHVNINGLTVLSSCDDEYMNIVYQKLIGENGIPETMKKQN